MNATPLDVPSHIPPALVVDFDYYNFVGGGEDVHLAWKKLHEGPELFWTPRNGGHWVATRADGIEEIFTDYRHFTSTRGQSIPMDRKSFAFPPVEYDPPEHTDYRRIALPFFTPKSIGALEAKARALTNDLIESFRSRGECEFYGEFALQMPIGIFLSLVDLPASDRLPLLKLAETVTRSSDTQAVQLAFERTWAYLSEKIAERTANPGNDLISAIAHAEIRGRRLDRHELLGFCSVVLFGGLDTVASTLGFITHFLAQSPSHRRQLIDDPALIPNAIEELVRRFAVPNLARSVTVDFEYKGIAMRAGDPVLIPSVLGCLDERRFPDPLAVDFARKRDGFHLDFGAGAHRCIGSLLARTELEVFLEEWLRRIPDFRVTPGKQAIARSGQVMAMIQLPLSWETQPA